MVLNEAFRNKDALLAKTSHPYRYLLGRQWWTVEDSGIIVLSRYRIVETASEHFRHRARADFWAAKGIVMCRLLHLSRNVLPCRNVTMPQGFGSAKALLTTIIGDLVGSITSGAPKDLLRQERLNTSGLSLPCSMHRNSCIMLWLAFTSLSHVLPLHALV